MFYPLLLVLASKLTPIDGSVEKERLLIDPSDCVNLKITLSYCKLAITISPSLNPRATVCMTGLYII